MSDETNALLGLIDQENARVIHYQEERANSTNIFFAAAGALIALVSIDQKICGNTDLFLAAILISLGLLGMFLNAKYHERIYYHEQLLGDYSNNLNKLLPKADIGKIRAAVKKAAKTESRFRSFFYKSTLWKTWVVANFIVVVIGITLAAVSAQTICS